MTPLIKGFKSGRSGILILAIVLLVPFQNCDGFRIELKRSSETNTSAPPDSSASTAVPVANPEAAPTPVSTIAPANPTPLPVAMVCRAPRHYQKIIQPGEETFLSCSGPDTIISMQIPDKGQAIGRAQLNFRNNSTNEIYYWSAAVVVGNGTVSYAVGNDICPNSSTPTRTILGFGKLTASENQVQVVGHQGASPCTNGQVGVFSGGLLDVWVEDSSPDCAGKDINMISSYDVYGVSSAPYVWSTSMTHILDLPVPTTTGRSQILVLGAVEGTPLENPNNVCGQENATLVSQMVTNNLGILSTTKDAIPASQGMGHLVLSASAQVAYSAALTNISLLVGSNTDRQITTDGCCGDGKIGFVKLP